MSTSLSLIKNSIRGGQIILHTFRMFNQVASRVVLLIVIIFMLFLVLWCYLNTTRYERYVLTQWGWAELGLLIDGDHATQSIRQPNGDKATVSSAQLIQSPFMQTTRQQFTTVLLHGIVLGLLVTLFVLVGLFVFLQRRGKSHTDDKPVSGDTLASPDLVKAMIIERGLASDCLLGRAQLPLIKGVERQHVLLDGTTGTGKSTVIKTLLDHIRRCGDRALIWDEGGHYLQEFYDEEQDTLLNVLDSRGAAWDLWHECFDVADFEQLAAALIPMVGVQDPFWVLGARTIFSEVAYAMRNDKTRSVKSLLQCLLTASLDNLKTYLDNTFASILVSDKIEKTAISIKSVMAAYLKCLRYVHDRGSPFSIRQWVQEDNAHGWLFITSQEKKHEALKPLITAWLDIAMNELLSLPSDPNRRVWVVLDELASLHKIPMLLKVLSKSRKVGGCVIVGLQNYAQLEQVYGHDGAKNMSSLLNTRFLFRQPEPALATWSARNAGERIVGEVKEGISYGANTMRDGVSLQRVETRKPVITMSDMMRLNDLQCYLRFPGDFPLTQLTFDYQSRVMRHPAFVVREVDEQDPVKPVSPVSNAPQSQPTSITDDEFSIDTI